MTRRRTTLQFTLLTAAVGLISLCLVVLACAPAGQGGILENPVATVVAPTPTLPAGVASESGWSGPGLPPPPTRTQMERQYPNLDGYFIRKIQEYEAATDAAEGLITTVHSGQPTPTLEVIDLFANINAHEYVDDVRRFLEENGALRIKCVKFSSDYIVQGQCAALVQVSLLRGLAEQPGVIRIEKVQVAQPAAELRSPALRQVNC